VVELDRPAAAVDSLSRVLSHDERYRADRFIFDRDRVRYITCRGVLRTALGAYLNQRPESVAFAYAKYGKPELDGVARGRLAFNVSHAAGLGVFAFAAAGALGVDVEQLERQVDIESLATRFFAPEEARELLALPASLRGEAFFNCWTRKEAYVKALGDGLTRPLHSFAVSLRPGDRAAMRWIDGDDARRWRLSAFEPAAGYVAAVAGLEAWNGLRLRHWTDFGVAGREAGAD
jgi:4'-phosphopantetheinyl transferase